MQVILDRNLCNRRDSSCDTCFANHLVQNDFPHATCWLSTLDTQRPEVVFKIYDCDHSIKTLVVTQENLLPALTSWTELWEQQCGPLI
ncbi:MAG TPA: hypothetical protein VI703_05465 [Anaerolineales bacterium]|jgi:hypothetical protein|nr:hypothetical protein [Anaerolineales bacterium]